MGIFQKDTEGEHMSIKMNNDRNGYNLLNKKMTHEYILMQIEK